MLDWLLYDFFADEFNSPLTEAARKYKENLQPAELIKVNEKIKPFYALAIYIF